MVPLSQVLVASPFFVVQKRLQTNSEPEMHQNFPGSLPFQDGGLIHATYIQWFTMVGVYAKLT